MKWTPEAEAALQDLKRYLSSMPILVTPKPQEPLLLYLAATNQVVSAVLVAQREVEEEATAAARPLGVELGPARPDPGEGGSPTGPEPGREGPPRGFDTDKAMTAQASKIKHKKKVVQHPIYFVSSLLQGDRSRYSGMQKLLFGLLMASRKLCHYFQAHEIAVVARLPLQ